MADPEFPLVDAREILRVVGGAAFTRGKGYANVEHVLDLEFEPTERMLSARVVGSDADPYETTVLLAGHPGAWTVGETWCSCPVGIDCKHAAAVLILSNTLHLRAQQVFFENTSAPEKVPAWQESLDALLGAGQRTASATSGTAGHGSHGAAERHLQPMALQFD